MGWSEWITGPPGRWEAWGRFLTVYQESADPVYGVLKIEGTGTPDALYAGIQGPTGVWRSHIQFLAAPNDADPLFALPNTPPGFSSITGGVWDHRPNYEPGDPSNRVEYEPGHVAEIAGWDWSGRPFVQNRNGDPMAATIEYVIPSSYFVGDGTGGYDLADHPFDPLPSGDVVLNVPADQYSGYLSPTPLPNPGAVFGFGVTVNVEDIGAPDPFNEPDVTLVLGNLYSLVAYPRWRYWTDAESKLRQVHRDDGLGTTPARARGASSRGATNRARAYD